MDHNAVKTTPADGDNQSIQITTTMEKMEFLNT